MPTTEAGVTPAALVQQPRPEILRVATQLLSVGAGRAGGRVLLLTGCTPGQSLATLAREMALASLEMGERPVLILDLETMAGDTCAALDGLPIVDLLADAAVPGDEEAGGAAVPAVARPVRAGWKPEDVLVALGRARERYSVIICAGGAIEENVPSVVVAGQADGVVLGVADNESSLGEVQAAEQRLRDLGASVAGFVMLTSRA